MLPGKARKDSMRTRPPQPSRTESTDATDIDARQNELFSSLNADTSANFTRRYSVYNNNETASTPRAHPPRPIRAPPPPRINPADIACAGQLRRIKHIHHPFPDQFAPQLRIAIEELAYHLVHKTIVRGMRGVFRSFDHARCVMGDGASARGYLEQTRGTFYCGGASMLFTPASNLPTVSVNPHAISHAVTIYKLDRRCNIMRDDARPGMVR